MCTVREKALIQEALRETKEKGHALNCTALAAHISERSSEVF